MVTSYVANIVFKKQLLSYSNIKMISAFLAYVHTHATCDIFAASSFSCTGHTIATCDRDMRPRHAAILSHVA